MESISLRLRGTINTYVIEADASISSEKTMRAVIKDFQDRCTEKLNSLKQKETKK